MVTSDGKVWFITGSSRGFGRVWTEAALKRGDEVVATARNPAVLAPLVKAYGEKILPLALDVTDRAAAFETVAKGKKAFGRLDIVLTRGRLRPEGSKLRWHESGHRGWL
jgi:NADP-dependent 3-hydroxy acid dehydrogenase YdfG